MNIALIALNVLLLGALCVAVLLVIKGRRSSRQVSEDQPASSTAIEAPVAVTQVNPATAPSPIASTAVASSHVPDSPTAPAVPRFVVVDAEDPAEAAPVPSAPSAAPSDPTAETGSSDDSHTGLAEQELAPIEDTDRVGLRAVDLEVGVDDVEPSPSDSSDDGDAPPADILPNGNGQQTAALAPGVPSPVETAGPRGRGAIERLHIGVLGCGYWGSKHVRVLSQQPNVNVTAIDRDITRLDELRSSFQALNTATTLDSVMHQLDGLVIATPASSHADFALDAIAHGAHVLIEKPLATSITDAERVLAAAHNAGVGVTVGHTFEFNPAVWALRDAVRSPEFGHIHYIDSARLNLGLYQPDVNVVWDLAPHDISIVLYLLDTMPDTVATWASNHVPGHQEDVAYVQLRFDQLGISANIHVSWLDPAKVRRTTVVGSRQMAVYNDISNERLRVFDKGVNDSATELYTAPITYREGDILSPYIDNREPLALEITEFLNSIRNGDASPASGIRGLNVVRVLEAAQRSIGVGGGRVAVAPTSLDLDALRIGAEATASS